MKLDPFNLIANIFTFFFHLICRIYSIISNVTSPHSPYFRSYEMNTTVAIDMRGFGWPEKPFGENNSHLIADLKALIKYLNREKFVLVSHDWGAIIASTISNQQILHKYILMEDPPRKVFKQLIDQSMDQRNRSSYILQFLKRGVAESELKANNYALLSPMFKKEDIDVYIYVFSQPGNCGPASYRSVR